MTALHEMSIAEAGSLLRQGTITSTQLTQSALRRVRNLDPIVHSFIRVTEERALFEAAACDRDFERSVDRGPMQGIPYAVKDIIDSAGEATTGSSKVHLDSIATEDAFVVKRLNAAGGILMGKLATYEFAIGGPSFDVPFPPARNPWNREYTTGGSSSGSAAAVAAGLVRTALGTDTGGSIRFPAHYCGVVGLKPTYGRISRRGVRRTSPTMDHVGLIARTTEDAALTLQILAGHDLDDAWSADVSVPDYGVDLRSGIEGMRLAFPRKFHAADPGISSEVLTALDAAVSVMERLGAHVEVIDFPQSDMIDACARLIFHAEGYESYGEFLRTRAADLGRFAYERLASGFVVQEHDLAHAFHVKRQLTAFLNDLVLSRYDAVIAANCLTVAQRFDAISAEVTPDWLPARSVIFNVTGNPALAVPVGFSDTGLPIGMQIAGRAFDEATILRIGAAYEAATHWFEHSPVLSKHISESA